ncbi:protein EMBRYONIC FLOWER 1 isoform X1 [Arachis duranensis]|uniref:Protein EMBRYONIC FLOWER 1 isoform X1 n=1 Tax=Arachis duranensis TaxID=130453 RepID=A0A6P4C6S3_ARADU|nr:protein EMBRYONIC FLOWER 1 isoform X1 [Arachis duranensis]XP_052111111.1 protein EMBRYONIC FLOWER 1 isoform X1 [Arachis duranensis]
MMGSFVQVNSISIDLADAIGDKASAGNCQHFSIRGYVSEIRKKDWKKCWPFPVNESEENPSLPPLDVPTYRCFGCESCHQESVTKDMDKDGQTDFNCCSSGCKSDTNCGKAAVKSGVQQDPMPDISERVEIDLNTNLNCVNDCLPITNEREKQPGFSLSRMIGDLEIGLDDNPNRLGLVQEFHLAKRGFECEQVSDVDPTVNLKYMENSSAEICNGGPSSVDSQRQKELQGACTILREGTSTMEADNDTVGDHIELADSDHTVPASMENIVENDFQDHDHHLEKSTGLSRRRPRKVRLMSDLLSENGELKIGQTATQGSPSHGISKASAASDSRLIFPGKVDMQGLTNNLGQKKRKLPPDEGRRPADMCEQRVDTEVQNLERDAETNNAVLDGGANSKDVLQGIGLQDATKACWSKHETERSHIMGKKKHRRIQVTDKHLIPEQQQGHHREDDDPVDAYKAYASKTISSKLSPRAFTGKGMDNFPFHDGVRFENGFNFSNFSKGKGKIPQTAAELDPLFCRKTDMLLEDSYPYSGGKIIPNIPGDIPVPLHHGRQTSQGLEEGVHLSFNNYLAAQVYSTKCIHQIENRLPLSLTMQEGTSNIHQLKRKDSEINAFGGPSIPSKHTNSISAGKGAHLEEIAGARIKEKPVEGVENLGSMKRYGEKTTELSEPGTLDDIPMEIVELMAKNQYERCLPDVENRSSKLEKSTARRKAQMTSGSAMHEMGVRLLKESQKDKSHGIPKKHNMVERENLKPCKRKPVHYSFPFDGNNLSMNNLCPPQLPFEFEVSQSQKKSPSGFQFSPMGPSHQLDSTRSGKFNLSLEERGSSNLEGQGGCSLHKTILQQDGEVSRIWASLTPNHISLGYDVPKKVVSQATSSNMDMASLRSNSLHKQNMKRDVDLNYINLNVASLEKLNRNRSAGTFSRINGEYPYPCKHKGMDHHQNLRGSLDLYSNETIPAMHLLSLMDAGMQSRTPFNVSGINGEMLKRSPCPGDCNTTLEIGTSKAHSIQKRQSSDYLRKNYLSEKPHSCFLGSPTLGASSSTQHDTKILKAAGFNGQNSTKSGRKEKIKSPNPMLQNQFTKPFSWPRFETETPLKCKIDVHSAQETPVPPKIISGNLCMVNKNPADFTMPTGNVYMIRGEDLKFEKSILKNKPHISTSHGFKQQKNSKGTKMKELSNH